MQGSEMVDQTFGLRNRGSTGPTKIGGSFRSRRNMFNQMP